MDDLNSLINRYVKIMDTYEPVFNSTSFQQAILNVEKQLRQVPLNVLLSAYNDLIRSFSATKTDPSVYKTFERLQKSGKDNNSISKNHVKAARSQVDSFIKDVSEYAVAENLALPEIKDILFQASADLFENVEFTLNNDSILSNDNVSFQDNETPAKTPPSQKERKLSLDTILSLILSIVLFFAQVIDNEHDRQQDALESQKDAISSELFRNEILEIERARDEKMNNLMNYMTTVLNNLQDIAENSQEIAEDHQATVEDIADLLKSRSSDCLQEADILQKPEAEK